MLTFGEARQAPVPRNELQTIGTKKVTVEKDEKGARNPKGTGMTRMLIINWNKKKVLEIMFFTNFLNNFSELLLSKLNILDFFNL